MTVGPQQKLVVVEASTTVSGFDVGLVKVTPLSVEMLVPVGIESKSIVTGGLPAAALNAARLPLPRNCVSVAEAGPVIAAVPATAVMHASAHALPITRPPNV
jgi:hypothetical protein